MITIAKKKTHEQYIDEVLKINPTVTVMGYYQNANIKILHKCNICNNEWMQKPSHILAGHGCKKCANNKLKECRTFSHEQFMENFNKLKNDNILIIGEYKNSYNKIECACKICNKKWKTLPGNILQGHGCPYCSDNYKKTHLILLNLYHKLMQMSI